MTPMKKRQNIARLAHRSLRRLRAPWDNTDPIHAVESTTGNIFFTASSHVDMKLAQFIDDRIKGEQTTLTRTLNIQTTKAKWVEWMEYEYSNCVIVEQDDTTGYIIDTVHSTMITYNTHNTSTVLSVHGDKRSVDRCCTLIEASFEVVVSHVEWVYSPSGDSVRIPLNYNNLPFNEMYPFLNGEPLTSYYDRYLQSDSNILLLIGPPGAGKTTFIRGLLAHAKTSALVTYDTSILEKDYVFAQFMEGSSSVMVLEDADMFLRTRTDGNSMMHRFLNVGDGLVTAKHKKLIFSTNLPSIRDVDPALVRPGRCFDVLTFSNLTHGEAQALADVVDITLNDTKDTWTVAEVFNQYKRASIVPSKVGFM